MEKIQLDKKVEKFYTSKMDETLLYTLVHLFCSKKIHSFSDYKLLAEWFDVYRFLRCDTHHLIEGVAYEIYCVSSTPYRYWEATRLVESSLTDAQQEGLMDYLRRLPV